jgi:outer membrane immunogenic protein
MEDRMKKHVLAGLALAALFGGSATAADLARPAPPVYAPPPPVVAYFTWTGCYVGGNVGGLWANWDWNAPLLGGDFGSQTASGAVGGLQAGCNYQVSNWVFGIQGDYDWSNASSSTNNAIASGFASAAVGVPIVITDQSQIKSLASVTGRVGYAWDRFLGYVKAGGAWEQSNYTLLVPAFAVPTVSETRSGWTVGVGGEYAFLNWLTGFVEYDYYGFGSSSNNNFTCAFAACGVPTGVIPVSVTTNINVIKAGVNFKFGG